ncbi:DUF3990 domain-containing protein [Streptomyces sp. NA04227]|uniref:DUF6531 domain-containing protein n=1 Tax=Streptomyces sp. NA04227 TaxID=2742136 RepID=UPI00158FE398|nr:DUF6531 domain-containing protein [Streptomyces sp. NA04227]QKW08594.1 DUF3990 domain-containing protein [Streptomyces sp. NA04227]
MVDWNPLHHVDDINPLKLINKFNHMAGDNLASMMQFLGISDPAVDPDGVRDIAKKWRALADAVDDSVTDAEKALAEVDWEGKTAKEFFKRAKKTRQHASKMADGLRDGADGLDKFADEAEQLLSELGVIVVEIIEVEMAGLALSVLTGGASAVVSSLAAGARFAKVTAIIARIEKAGTALGRTIRVVMETIRALIRALRALKQIKGVAQAGKLAAQGAKYSALDALLQDPSTFKDPEKLAETLAMGAALGVGLGGLGKLLGKGLGKLKPKDLSKLRQTLKLNCSTLNRMKARPGWDKLPASVQNALKKFVRDPIDVATGDMALTQKDAELPGVLPLILERTHISSYRYGGWFGPSWASTIDQRLQIDEEGVVYVAADGSRLCFPLPDSDSGEAVRPETPGSRLTLRFAPGFDGALHVNDPDSGLTYAFHSPVPAAEGTAIDLPLQYIHDRNGNRVTIEYDEKLSDLPRTVVHSGGYRIALDRHETLDRIVRLRLLDPSDSDSAGTTLISFGYDETGQLTEEVNSSGLPMRYTYDDEGRITSWTDRNGTMYWYLYDERGRVVETGGTGGALASTLSYEDGTRTTRVTDSLGHTRVYEHNESCRLVRETDPLGNVTVREWDESLRLTSVADPLGHTSRYTYGECGRVTAEIRPDGAMLTTEYNHLGLPTVVTDPDGSRWVQEYEDGKPVTATDPAGRTTRFTYNPAGHLTAVTDAFGNTTLIRNNPAGLPLEVTDAQGAVTRYERDAFGRPNRQVDPFGAETRLEWTVEGKHARRITADGSEETWLYDGEGNCIRHIDTNGGVSQFEFSHFDVMSARTSPDGVRYEFTYDTELRLARVLNPQGLAWTYTYDPAGRLIAEADFDGRAQHYAYDLAGRLKEKTTPLGDVIRYQRDTIGLALRKVAADQVTEYCYDSMGRLERAAGPDAVLEVIRDEFGQVRCERVNGHELSYTYDELGRRDGRRTPSGAVSTWQYDSAGNLTELTASGRALRFSHDVLGREVEREFGAAGGLVTLSTVFDQVGRPTEQILVSGERTLKALNFEYRPDNYLNSLSDSVTGTTQRFTLDATGRPLAVAAHDWDETYAYDSAGNQREAQWPDGVPNSDVRGHRTYCGTRVLTAGKLRYEYDEAGRTIVRQRPRLSRRPDTWHYTYDAESRLTSCVTPDGTTWRYLYDPLNRRIGKQKLAADEESVVEHVNFTWDGSRLVEEASTATGIVRTWDYAGHRPLTQTERRIGGDEDEVKFYAVVSDAVGTPTELVDEAGGIAWQSRSTLWGTVSWNENATAYTPLRFPGQYADLETGLHYNYFRHYDPGIGRYTTPDPLGLAPSPNPTAYVSNPRVFTDSTGLAPDCDDFVDLYHGTDRVAERNIRAGGVDTGRSSRPMDFGNGFYTTRDRQQAEDWAARFGDQGAVLHFRIPKGEFDSLSSKVFQRDDPVLVDFVRYYRGGGKGELYEVVEGPMLRNINPFMKKGRPPVWSGNQVTFFGDRAGGILTRALQ